MKICWKCTYPSRCRLVFCFINVALHRLLIGGSSAVNGCRQKFKISQEYTSGLYNKVCQLMSCEVKNCMFVINKSIVLVKKSTTCWISFWRHPFTVGDPLVRIYFRWTISLNKWSTHCISQSIFYLLIKLFLIIKWSKCITFDMICPSLVF